MGSPCCFHQGPRPLLAVLTYSRVTRAEIEAQPSNEVVAVAPAGSSTLQETKFSSNTAAETLGLWRPQSTEVGGSNPSCFLTSPPDLSLSGPDSLSWSVPCLYLYNDITLSHAILCFSDVQLLSPGPMLAIGTHEGTRPRPCPEEA